jgi:photosystem II stability/assembly factor-like uncharacterized protein
MSNPNRTHRRPFAALATGFLALGFALLASEPPKSLVAKDADEGGAIEKRKEWFYQPRVAGAEGRMAQKRLEAVLQARAARAECRVEDGETWVPRGPFASNFSTWRFGKVTGRIAALAKDFQNNILYVGSASGGLWRSLDDGNSYEPIFDAAGTQTIGAITLDPNDPKTLWVGTGENSAWCEDYFGVGLLRSRDGGITWEPRNGSGSKTLENLATFASIDIDPRNSNRLVVGGFYRDCLHGHTWAGGIYTTDDGGETWTKRFPGYVTEIARDPSNPDILWAGLAYGGVHKSVDGGNTWSLQTASSLPSGWVGRVEVAVAPSSPQTVYALFESVGGEPQFWATSDGGATWALASRGDSACDGQCWYNMVLRVDPANPAAIYRGTIHLFVSLNGGSTWRDLSNEWGPAQSVHQDTHALLLDPGASGTFYVGCDGGVWKSSDAGATMQNLNGNMSLTQFYDVGIHPTDDGIITGGSQDNSSLARSTSDTWDLQEVTGDGFTTAIDPVDPNVVYISSYPYPFDENRLPQVYRSDSGLFGTYAYASGNGIHAGDRINWVTPYALLPDRPTTLYLGTHRVYRSKDRGASWTPVGPEDMCEGQAYLVVVHPSTPDTETAYAGSTNGRVWQTRDGGGTWTEMAGSLPARWVNDIDTDPADPLRVYVALSGFGTAHLYGRTAASEDWEPLGAGLPDVPANAVAALTSSQILVGTDVGIFRSTDGGVTFLPFCAGMPEGLVVTDLEVNRRTWTVTAGTYGRGAWQWSYGGCAVGCAASVPEETVAHQGTAFTAAAFAPHCSGPITYVWDFGDGTSSSEASVSHTYGAAGVYSWKLSATAGGASAVKTGQISVTGVPLPQVTSMTASFMSAFKIKVIGSNFQKGIRVAINGQPWGNVSRKNPTTLNIKGGKTLKKTVPQGIPAVFTFTNPDGGVRTVTWGW